VPGPPRLSLEELPADAPELNPTEQMWNDFTGHLANSLLQDSRDLRRRLSATTRRVRRSQAKLRSFIRSSKLPSPRENILVAYAKLNKRAFSHASRASRWLCSWTSKALAAWTRSWSRHGSYWAWLI
jgi:hypothetical protein